VNKASRLDDKGTAGAMKKKRKIKRENGIIRKMTFRF
jgi:hypothetical protein